MHKTPEPPIKLWNTAETAEYLNVSSSWLTKHRDSIPHVRLGRAVRYNPDVVREFVCGTAMLSAA